MHPEVPERNRLLRALSRAEYAAILPSLHTVELTEGDVLFEPGEKIASVYFPQSCVVSLLACGRADAGVEVALVGYEGVVGLSIFLGATHSSLRAVLQVPDHAWRMSAAAFRRTVRRSAGFRRVLGRYANTLVTQVAYTVRCGQYHTVDARCARWLLMAHDRVGIDRFTLTQSFLGQMLGVQRSTVSSSAARLQSLGLIEYARGRLAVTNRAGLEAAACDCYALVAEDYRSTFAR